MGCADPRVAGGHVTRGRRDSAGQADAEPAHHRSSRRRLPSARCRDGDARLARHADDRSAVDGSDRGRSLRRRDAARSIEPRGPGFAARASPGRRSHPQGASRTAAGSVAVRQMPPRCCAGLASTTRPGRRAGRRCPFCLVGGRARVRGIGELVEPLTFEAIDVTLVIPPMSVSTPVVYRAWDELGRPHSDGSNDLEQAAVAAFPSWPPGATGSRRRRGVHRRWPAAARPGSSSATTISTSCPTLWPCARCRADDRPRRVRRPLCGGRPATKFRRSLVALALVTRTAKHLLVLLLAHALAALLDQRTHSS